MHMTKPLTAVFFDFDSTLVSKESFDEVIALAVTESPDRDAPPLPAVTSSYCCDLTNNLLPMSVQENTPAVLFARRFAPTAARNPIDDFEARYRSSV